ncbi:MAG: hemolysin family protein [Geminicoccaceae bacterium]
MNDPAAGSGREDRATFLKTLLSRLRLLTRRKNGDGHSLRETLEELIEEDEGIDQQSRPEFSDEERAILLNALSFGSLQVWDVMVPRSDIKSIDSASTLGEVIDTMRESTHTRLPVVRDILDDIVGMVHLKDLLPFWGDGEDFALQSILRELLFVPPSMKVLDLLMKMRDTGIHMAIVIDEYGGTDGMVTIEDLVEEIVGEIQDEHDKILPPSLNERPDGSIEADARVDIEDLEKHLALELLETERREDVDTLGGLIFTLVDRVPARGEIVRHQCGIEFEVLDADPRRVKRVLIRQPQPLAAIRQSSATGSD